MYIFKLGIYTHIYNPVRHFDDTASAFSANAVKIPVIGMGGIMTAEDALEFILAGATAVSIGTANFINSDTTIQVIEGIEAYMKKYGVEDIHELIGAVH